MLSNLYCRLKNRVRSQTPIRHGHVYRDTITGEQFTILTVGRWVELERHDADRRPEHSVQKEKMLGAIESGIVEHDHEQCSSCDNQ